ncbi:MAG TPA: hypothetical protein VN429_04460 [Methanospirillum sp.]|uniref:hypothetical protein n=1 Tax=Methanospirillum sp. TaxID=45200 RepID=UPI002C4D91F1|nr:hypothetical protein [Methanospirillum sp.]HWQ63648.1 hypothetical protein [Methanospirillum sp.]
MTPGKDRTTRELYSVRPIPVFDDELTLRKHIEHPALVRFVIVPKVMSIKPLTKVDHLAGSAP